MRAWALLLLSASLPAQVPRLSNARIETRSAAGGLEKEFRSLMGASPAWIGYTVAAVRWHEQGCDYSRYTTAPGPIHLEPPEQVRVLFRVEQNKVGKIRTISPDCDIDAGGLPVYWLTDVRPAESVAWLSSLAMERDRVGDSAVTAIALHGDSAADQALEKFVAPDQPESLRRRAAFWLGAARGRRGFEILKQVVTGDPSDKVRDRALSGLAQSTEPEAVDTLIQTARNDKSPRVRGQALFWLAHKAGQKAIEAITEAVEKDPETEVKRRAVFALQQLPSDQGIPLLIQVARGNKNPAVRKQAMFWLGQSRDPRALAFFEEILKSN